LRDEELFKQPPKPDDCPMTFLMLPEFEVSGIFMACCGKMICAGCRHAHQLQTNGGCPTCPFCRADIPEDAEETMSMLRKRADANDAMATFQLGWKYLNGDDDENVKKDMDKAIKLLHRAAELGSALSCWNLGVMYDTGHGVSTDEKKAKQFF
jgi:TPR repeat protein